jgi:hypothetical protein
MAVVWRGEPVPAEATLPSRLGELVILPSQRHMPEAVLEQIPVAS